MNSPDLRGVRILADMNNSQVSALGAFGRIVNSPRGEQIASQGEPADAMYFLLQGEAAAYVTDGNGGEVHLRTLEPGGYFGEIGLLESGHRTATVKAITDCTLFRLDAASFKRLLQVHDLAAPLLHGLSRSLAIRLADITRRMSDLRSFAEHWSV